MTEKYQWVQQLATAWAADWNYVHCPDHSAGFACDPEFAGLEKPADVEVDFLGVAERMLRAAPSELGLSIDNLSAELAAFK